MLRSHARQVGIQISLRLKKGPGFKVAASLRESARVVNLFKASSRRLLRLLFFQFQERDEVGDGLGGEAGFEAFGHEGAGGDF